MSSANQTRSNGAPGPAKLGVNRRRPKRKRTRDRAGKQQALIQAALRLFARKGYESTTTREIAACAGCAEGLIHRYFDGKAGLLVALVEHRISQEIVDLNNQLRPAPNFADEFTQLVDWEVERMWESRDFLRVFIPRAIVDRAIAGVMNRAVVSVRTPAIRERLRRYQPCLTLPQDELETLAQSVGMLGLIFGFMRPLVLGQDRLRAKQMAATIARILIRSVDSNGGGESSLAKYPGQLF